MNIPQGHQAVMPYLVLDNAAAFVTFITDVFAATTTVNKMRADNKIMHSEANVQGCTIMFADSTEQWAAQTASLFIYVADADESYRKALEAGASVVMELSDQDYGRTCGVTDPTGNTWWITAEKS